MSFFKKINFTSGFKKILTNTSYLFGEKVVNMGLGLIVGIYVARYLGPSEYGLWQYAQSLIALVTAIAGLGTTNIVIRDLVDKGQKDEGKILGTTFLLMLIAGIVTVIFIVGVGFWLNNEVVTRWLIIIASVNLILQSFQVFDYWFQAKVLSKYSVYARISGQIAASILKVLFILLSLNVIYFALTIVVAGIFRVIVWMISYEKQGKGISNWQFDNKYAQMLLKDTWPLILSGLSVAIYMKIDQVMLKNMVNSTAVGNYAVAVKLSELWYFIPMTIASSVFPTIIESKKTSLEKYYRRLQYLYDILAGIALLIALPMTFLSSSIIYLLFGTEYSLAGPVLAIHIWSGIFVFLGVARGKWIINENYQRFTMIFMILGAIVNVLLNISLIPLWGIMGATWATVISQALSSWLFSYFIKETRISFKMQGLAILKSLMIYPTFKSFKKILIEAQE